jgi:nucleoside-diphosphate-sugar epimerase
VSSDRVLVTGATGFIGRPVVGALAARGLEVHGVSSRQIRDVYDQVIWHQADLLDAAQTAALVDRVRPSRLVHLAWDVQPGAWAGAGSHLAWLRAGVHLLERFAAAGGQRVVMTGSGAEYDWQAGVCSERTTPLAPATLYGTTKLALAQVLAAYGRDTGLSTAWARVFFTYGPHENERRLVASVVRSLLAGEPAACTDGRQVRDFLYVDDVAAAIVALLESPVTGAVNVASGEPLSVAALATRIGTLLGRPELVQLGARPTPANETPLVVADVSRLTQEVGWTPAYSLDEGLEATAAWWRTQGAREVAIHD